MQKKDIKFFILFSIIFIELWKESTMSEIDENTAKFEFPQFNYKRKPQYENHFKNAYNKCQVKEECVSFYTDIDRENCIYKCISNKCYQQIYSFNPLEEGEIDQRITSFKGCVSEEQSNS